MNQSDILKLICNARMRHLGLRKLLSLSAEDDILNKYADFLEKIYKYHMYKNASEQYAEMNFEEHLT